MNLKHAVVALDLSNSSNAIVNCLPDLKELGLERVTLLTAVSNPYPGGPEKFDQAPFQEKLDRHKTELESAGIRAETDLRIATNVYAPVSILKAAEEHKADWLILGNRGHNRFSELFLGSTATEILQRGAIPILLLRISASPGGDYQAECGQILSHVLLPTDFSLNADRALSLIEKGPIKPKRITILHISKEADADIGDELTERVERLEMRGHESVDAELDNGKPFMRILHYCDKHKPSLVVMGSQGKGHMADLFIGSESLRVARYINHPLLLIPAEKS